MMRIMVLTQVAVPVVTITPPMPSFDLAMVKPLSPCKDIDFAAVQTDVVVCAPRERRPDILPADAFASKPFRPSVDVLGGVADVAAEQRSTLMGSAPAAMARFKLKF